MPHPNPRSIMPCSLTRLLSTMHNPHRCRSAVLLTCTSTASAPVTSHTCRTAYPLLPVAPHFPACCTASKPVAKQILTCYTAHSHLTHHTSITYIRHTLFLHLPHPHPACTMSSYYSISPVPIGLMSIPNPCLLAAAQQLRSSVALLAHTCPVPPTPSPLAHSSISETTMSECSKLLQTRRFSTPSSGDTIGHTSGVGTRKPILTPQPVQLPVTLLLFASCAARRAFLVGLSAQESETIMADHKAIMSITLLPCWLYVADAVRQYCLLALS